MEGMMDIDELLKPAIEAFKETAQAAIDATTDRMENVLRVTYGPAKAIVPEGCPTPRIQLRWEEAENPRWDYTCFYEFVFATREHDIRTEDGASPFCVIQLGKTNTGGQRTWENVGKEKPYRDGAHASWDAPHFGNPPVYVIAPDGRFALVEKICA